MATKHTTQSFIARAKEVHGNKYNYDKVDYQGYYTKVIITCPIHGDFLQTPGNHLEGRGCKECQMSAQRCTTTQFVEKARKIHGNTYDYSKVDYKNGKTNVIIICPKHGEFTQLPNNHLMGNGCPVCRIATKVTTNKQSPVTTETFIEKAKSIHNDKYDYSKVNYLSNRHPVEIICPTHGSFFQRPSDHVTKKSGCPKCGHHVYTQDSFIEKCNKIHHHKYDYSKTIYRSIRDKIIITCPEHGDFEQVTKTHLEGAGCLRCRLKQQTKLFNRICEMFPDENILFEVNKDIVHWIGQQRLDIYFPVYNIAIEYDGLQHSQPIEIFGGEERFCQQQILDQNKNNLCAENHCHLFRVSYNYTEEYFDNICSQIKNIIKEYKES